MIQRGRRIVLKFGSIVLTIALMSGQTYAEWQIGAPIVTYWNDSFLWGLRLTDARAQMVVDGGYNLVDIGWDVSNEIESAKRHGLRVQLRSPLLSAASLDGGTQQAQLDALIDEFKSHPSVAYSYYIDDEPHASEFAGLAQIVSYLHQRDPDRMAYVNLLGNTAVLDWGTPTHAQYLDQFTSTVQPQKLLSYDHYQFRLNNGTPYDERSYLHNLAIFRQAAIDEGVPFMNIVQACAFDNVASVPTTEQLRYLANTTLAYGAQGISYFNATAGEGGIYNYDPPDFTFPPSDIYTALQPINHDFRAIASELQQQTSIGAYIKGYAESSGPPGTTRLPDNSPFSVTGVSDTLSYVNDTPVQGASVGLFGQGSSLADARYAMVVNNDYTANKEITVTGPGYLAVYNATTGEWTRTGSNQAILNLVPGGGTLVRVASNTFTETFNTEASAAAHGWTTLGDGAGNLGAENNVGFINANFAGGVAAGEAQANFRQSNTQVYYADTDLGMTVNGNTPGGFTASGKLDVIALQNEPDFGLAPLVGFFNSTSSSGIGQDRLGIVFNNNGPDLVWGIVFIAGGGVPFFAGFDAAHTIELGVDRTFSLDFDPAAGANGRVTASISGAGTEFSIDLTAGQRNALNSMAFDAFGFQLSNSGASINRGANFRFDDVTYTHAVTTLTGDYNNDGAVDVLDYVLWRMTDINGQQGYDDWRSNFGSPSAGGGMGSGLLNSVPEPHAFFMLLVGATGSLMVSQRRRAPSACKKVV